MSAWGIGATTATRRGLGVRRAGADSATVEPPVPSIDTLVTWIPGEVVTAYAAIVLALQPEGTSGGQPPIEITWSGWLFAGFVFAALLTWLGGWSKSANPDKKLKQELMVRAGAAGVAFLIWRVVVPGSWWYSIKLIADNQSVVPLVVGLIGTVFALFAEGAVRRVGGQPQ